MKNIKIIIIYCIIIGVFCTGYWCYRYKIDKKVFYLREYEQGKDDQGISDLLEENVFWVFHDPDYKEVKAKLLQDIALKSHHHYDDGSKDGMKSDYKTVVACLKSGEVVGFINYYIFDIENTNHENKKLKMSRIHLLAVRKQFRRMGIAEQLLHFILDDMKKKYVNRVFLVTRPENVRAKNLYYKFSFVEVDRQNRDIFEKNGYDVLLKDL